MQDGCFFLRLPPPKELHIQPDFEAQIAAAFYDAVLAFKKVKTQSVRNAEPQFFQCSILLEDLKGPPESTT